MQSRYEHLVNGLVAWFSGVSVNAEPKVKSRSPSEGNGANGFRINSLATFVAWPGLLITCIGVFANL